jgi:hypothetical protein
MDSLKDIPPRLAPHIRMTAANERIPMLKGPFRLQRDGLDVGVESDLVFRWLPRSAVEFSGPSELASGKTVFQASPGDGWELVPSADVSVRLPVIVWSIEPGKGRVRGTLQKSVAIGVGPMARIRFCLANFATYMGTGIVRETDDGKSYENGRLEFSGASGTCRIDSIAEAKDMIAEARADGGFAISHVGEWVPHAGLMSADEAEEALRMLHFWFGFVNGTWAGPLFCEGLDGESNVVWRDLGPSRLNGGGQRVRTWLPEFQRLTLSEPFQTFERLWRQKDWTEPLILTTAWLAEANGTTTNETRIVVAQVALELLSWVYLVETQKLHSRRDLEVLSAAGRIRALLHQLRIPAAIPPHLSHLAGLCRDDAFDGPGVITRIRNAFVHANKTKRESIANVDGVHLWECAELATGYVELVVLAILGYRQTYCQRGWRGHKGADEAPVPWGVKS